MGSRLVGATARCALLLETFGRAFRVRRAQAQVQAGLRPLILTLSLGVLGVAPAIGAVGHQPTGSQTLSAADLSVDRTIQRDTARLERWRSPEARAERRRSRTRFRGLSRTAALNAAQAAFPDELTGRLFDGARPDPGVRVVKRLRGGAAVTEDAEGNKTVLQSSLPLETANSAGDQAPVDLSLAPDAAGFHTRNAFIDLKIDDQSHRGVSLPDADVSIVPGGAVNAPASESDDRVFYANTQTDTDFVVTPRPAGAELGWQLRSDDSPEQLTFEVDLPAGAVLRRARTDDPIPGDPPQSIEIARGNTTLAHIHPPNTYDADGAPVPSEAWIQGDTVVVSVRHRDGDYHYPLFVDPEVQVNDYHGSNWKGWQVVATPYNITPGTKNYFGSSFNNCDYYCGLYLSMPSNTTYSWTGAFAYWQYRAIANTYIYAGTLGGMSHVPDMPYANFGAAYNTYPWVFSRWYNGMQNGTFTGWEANTDYINQSGAYGGNPFGPSWGAASGVTHGFCLKPPAGTSGARCNRQWRSSSDTNAMILGLAAQNDINHNDIPGNTIRHSTVTMSWANTYLNDRYAPTMSLWPTDKPWADDSANLIHTSAPKAHDDGLGINGVTLSGAAWGNVTLRPPTCTGDPQRAPCPLDWTANSFNYSLDEGVTTLRIKPVDIVDNVGVEQSWKERIDRLGPTIDASGPLKDLETTIDDSGVDLFPLKVVVRDGDATGPESARRVGVRDATVYVAGEEIAHATSDPACTDSCSIVMDDVVFDTDRVAEGTPQVKVVAFDRLGHRSEISWNIHVVRDIYYAAKLAAWTADVQSRVDQANPLPLTAPMPAPPAQWQDPVQCEQDTPRMGACFDANNAWGRDIAAWLGSNPMLTATFGSLPLPPIFEYARSRTSLQLTRGMRAAFQSAQPVTEDPTRPLRVVLGFHAPVSRSQLLTLMPALDLQSGVELRGVFDPAGPNISMGYQSADQLGLPLPLPIGGHLDRFYQEQLDQNALDIAQFQQELAGDVDGDPGDGDDTAALQEALNGEFALEPILQAKGQLISGISANMTLSVLNGLLTTISAPIKTMRILSPTTGPADPDLPSDNPLNDMLTDAEMVTQSIAARSASATSGQTTQAGAAAREEGVPAPPGDKRTCAQLSQEGYDHAPTHTAPFAISYRVSRYGYPDPADPQGLVRKRASMGMRWTGDNLGWYCGDDPYDRGFEPETKVQTTNGPRWGVDQQNYGWKSNMPSPYLDDLNGGPENLFKKDRFPDFAVGTPNARALKYNTLYYTRNIIDKGETNAGYVVARVTSTHRPILASGQNLYCYGKGRGQDSACYFRELTCTVGTDQVPMTRSRRYKIGWSQQEADQKCVR